MLVGEGVEMSKEVVLIEGEVVGEVALLPLLLEVTVVNSSSSSLSVAVSMSVENSRRWVWLSMLLLLEGV